jgi:beta-lactamase regulating signal transducer with metallopeptidase domain
MSSTTMALGWTLVHFLWQGALLAGLAALGLWTLAGRDSRLRYAMACAALMLMTVAPPLTYLVLRTPSAAPQDSMAGSPTPAGQFRGAAQVPARDSRPQPDRLERAMPHVVLLWGLGCLAMSLRLVGSWLWLQWLRRRPETRPAPDEIQLRLLRLCQRMAVGSNLRLLICRSVTGPTVLGWLRPVILIPPAMLLGLSAEQLELILAHELAHVLRHDYLVNLLQSLAEVLLFFHPAIWWLSGQIRREREQAADDLAVRLRGDPLEYACALTAMEVLASRLDHPSTVPNLGLRAQGGSFMTRIQRLISPAAPTQLAPRAGLVILLFLGGGYALQARRQTPQWDLATGPSAMARARVAVAAPASASDGSEGHAKALPAPRQEPPAAPAVEEDLLAPGTVLVRRYEVDAADGHAKAGTIDLRAQACSLECLESALSGLQALPVDPVSGYAEMILLTKEGHTPGRWTYKFLGVDPARVANIIRAQAAVAATEKKPGVLRLLRINAFTYEAGLLPRGLKVTVWAGGVPADLVLQALAELEAMTPLAGIPQEVRREIRAGEGRGPIVDLNLREVDPLELRAILERVLAGQKP